MGTMARTWTVKVRKAGYADSDGVWPMRRSMRVDQGVAGARLPMFTLRTPYDVDVPVHARPVAWWGDNSVKWLQLEWHASEVGDYTLTCSVGCTPWSDKEGGRE